MGLLGKSLVLAASVLATPAAAPTPRIGQFVCTRINVAGNCAPNHWIPAPTPAPTGVAGECECTNLHVSGNLTIGGGMPDGLGAEPTP